MDKNQFRHQAWLPVASGGTSQAVLTCRKTTIQTLVVLSFRLRRLGLEFRKREKKFRPIMFSFASPGLSYVRGLDPEGPLVDWTIHEAFLRAERDEGCCKTFIVSVHQERCLTYGQVGILARAFAANLLGRLGFRRGDRLGIWLPNR